MLFSLFLLAIISISCEEEEVEISGDSGLIVVNDLSVDADIYFDGDYIGDVDDDDSREWSVPSGNHTVKADCSYMGDIEESKYFPKDNKIRMTLFVENSSNNILYLTVSDKTLYK
ncbi:MAG: hypothetical protein KOO66_05160 [Bacteroidales bacterium]|nr:hypothetical protein [Bacteroidales bacterium]